jgi:dissimilatory sulfite reductase related protein
MRHDSQTIAAPIDEEGYLVNPADWSEAIAAELARREGVALGEAHWSVIRFMREYYEQRHIAPDARHVIRFLADTRAADRNELFRLFPYGYVKQACKIAGMRKPRAWSTG